MPQKRYISQPRAVNHTVCTARIAHDAPVNPLVIEYCAQMIRRKHDADNRSEQMRSHAKFDIAAVPTKRR